MTTLELQRSRQGRARRRAASHDRRRQVSALTARATAMFWARRDHRGAL